MECSGILSYAIRYLPILGVVVCYFFIKEHPIIFTLILIFGHAFRIHMNIAYGFPVAKRPVGPP